MLFLNFFVCNPICEINIFSQIGLQTKQKISKTTIEDSYSQNTFTDKQNVNKRPISNQSPDNSSNISVKQKKKQGKNNYTIL